MNNKKRRGLILLPAFLGLFLTLSFRSSWAAKSAFKPDTRDRWDKKWGPLVPHKTFPKKCDICHVAKRWDVLRPDFHYDHLKETGFALEGAHAKIACLQCHNDRIPTKALISRSCSACHVDPHKASFGLDCKRCHNEVNWTPMETTLSIHARTRFPLTGFHATVQCIQCHARAEAKDFSGAPVDCYSCHQNDYTSAPNHVSMNFPHTCQNCHTTTNFTSALFDHSALGPNPNCMSCHSNDYNNASAPGATPVQHDPINYPSSNCISCHGDFRSWLNGMGGHNHILPLTGAHNTACTNCHNATLGQTHTDWTCTTCHGALDTGHGSYNTTSPSHASMSWPSDMTSCQNCHGDLIAWINGPSNAAPKHASFTGGFSLSGQHLNTGKSNAGGVVSSCDGCHANSNSFISGTSCVPCHQQDYANASLPTASPVVHDSTNYPSSGCASCHGDFTAWTNGTGHNHIDPLTGKHNTACTNCHNANLGQTQTNWTCSNCHQNYDTGGGDFVNATNPIDHDMKNGGKYALPTACDNCHTYQSAWTTSLITPHPTGSCGGGTGSSTPWNHENVVSCSDCHSTVTSMTAADGSFNCSLCHSGHHAGTPAGQCGT